MFSVTSCSLDAHLQRDKLRCVKVILDTLKNITNALNRTQKGAGQHHLP
jgi:hypothetical protein